MCVISSFHYGGIELKIEIGLLTTHICNLTRVLEEEGQWKQDTLARQKANIKANEALRSEECLK